MGSGSGSGSESGWGTDRGPGWDPGHPDSGPGREGVRVQIGIQVIRIEVRVGVGVQVGNLGNLKLPRNYADGNKVMLEKSRFGKTSCLKRRRV